MRAAVLDLETSYKDVDKEYGRNCNPLNPKNEVNVYGLLDLSTGVSRIDTDYEGDLRPNLRLGISDYDLLIGQNVRFDLLYLWDKPEMTEFLLKGGKLWDTRDVEYIIQNHLTYNALDPRTHLNLNALAVRYEGTQKIDKTKELYEAGWTTAMIGQAYPEMMHEYNKGDIENTGLIARKQSVIINQRQQMPVVEVYMDHYLATTEMEYNGMSVNKELGIQNAKECYEKRIQVLEETKRLVGHMLPEGVEYVPTDRYISSILFGGEVHWDGRVPSPTPSGITHYLSGAKKGELRTKKAVLSQVIKGYGLDTEYTVLNKDGKYYAVGEKILSKIAEKNDQVSEFVKLVLDYRKYEKRQTTYYISPVPTEEDGPKTKYTGLLTQVHSYDGKLHPQFKTCNTVTSRLSSADPNAQNLDKYTTELIESQWGDQGRIIECDFSQLEMVILAWLSGSTQMLADITNGLDFHCLRLSYFLGESYEDVFRKCKIEKDSDYIFMRKSIAKPISFGKSYGKFPDAIARDLELDPVMVNRVFQLEDERYPEVVLFGDLVEEEALRTSRPIGLPAMIGRSKAMKGMPLPFGYSEEKEGVITHPDEQEVHGYYRTVFGQIFTFKQKCYLTKRGNVWRTFNRPEIQNYPVQGTASLLVKMMTAEVFRTYALHHRDTMRLIGEIHDALLIDTKASHDKQHALAIKSIMEDTKSVVRRRFGIVFDAPISVDFGIGRTWAEAKEEE